MDTYNQIKHASTKSNLIRISTLYDFAFKALVFLAVFDGIRHNSIFHQFSIFKEILLYSLVGALLYELRFKVKNPIKYLDLTLFPIYLILVGTLITIGNLDLLQELLHKDPPINPIALHVKTLNFFLLIFLFSNYTLLTNNSLSNLVAFCVHVSIFYIVFSVISYMVEFPFINEFRPYKGRMSSGYPTADSQSLSFTLISFFYLGNKQGKYVELKLAIIYFGIIMQATTTGVATISMIFVSLLVFGQSMKGKRSYTLFLRSLVILLVCLLVVVFYVFTIVDKKIVDSFLMLLSAKSEFILYYAKLKLLGVDSETSGHFVTATYHVRQEEIRSVMQKYNSPIELLFGKGTALGSVIENQFGFVLRSYGYLGVLFYSLFYLGSLKRAWFLGRGKFLMAGLVLMILLLTSVSQISSYLFQISCAFAIAFNSVFSELSTKNTGE